MTLKDREAVFSKEVVTIKDLMQLYELKYQRACQLMRELKYHGDRLEIRGRIHFEDYKQALKLKTMRYFETYQMKTVTMPQGVVAINEFKKEQQNYEVQYSN